jgi:ATP adenylyltransferase
VVMNRYPYNNGHLMIVPYRHCADFDQISAEDSLELMQESQRATRILRRLFGAQGFNVGMNLGKAAGAGIAEHVHIHVVPRWVGDTNFMPVLADIKVMPDYLEATYEKLVPFFQEQREQEGPCSSR